MPAFPLMLLQPANILVELVTAAVVQFAPTRIVLKFEQLVNICAMLVTLDVPQPLAKPLMSSLQRLSD